MPTFPAQSPKLEVVVTDLYDAIEAHAGGADRLEIVADLSVGGLTPTETLIQSISEAVPLPCRVMLRTNSSMILNATAADWVQLAKTAEEFATIPSVNGFVFGFLTKDGELDLQTTKRLANVVPHLPFTFHRAFDELANPRTAIEQLSASLPNLDRILTTGATTTNNLSWSQRADIITDWQNAFPHLTFLMASGPKPDDILLMSAKHDIREIHIGRAARLPATNEGPVSRARVAAVKRNLLAASLAIG